MSKEDTMWIDYNIFPLLLLCVISLIIDQKDTSKDMIHKSDILLIIILLLWLEISLKLYKTTLPPLWKS